MDDLIRRSEAQELLECYTEKNNLGHTPYQIVSNLPSAGPKWISVEERLPGPYDIAIISILTKNGLGEPSTVETIGWYEKGAWIDVYGKAVGPEERVTHWMPLPEPPEEGGDEG